jgi:asparagine synthase (glutamine-hydrolysing)
MQRSLAHRGPDDVGLWQLAEQKLHLAHRRLSIIDLADGHQPMHSHDGRFTIVFNGEIYNHLELRRELEDLGARFITDHSNTEVLIEGFRQWGLDLFPRCNGMWALALWDHDRKQLLLVRDRMGQKPLYWGLRNGTFVFASQLNTLHQHPALVDCSINSLALAKYFGYGFIPAPLSLYEGISKLKPGCWLTIDAEQQVQEGQYYTFQHEPRETISFEAAQEELRLRLSRAVKRRLLADVPVGLFLSGGIDSSTVGYFAGQHGLNQAFYVGFDEPSFDESGYIHEAAKALSLQTRGETLAMAAIPEQIDRTLGMLDEPMADPSLIPTSMLCKSAAQHVKVAIGGDGADELLAGYDPYLALRFAQIYQKCAPEWGHRLASWLVNQLPVSHRNMSLEFKLKRTLAGVKYPAEEWAVRWMAPTPTGQIRQLLDQQFTDGEIYSEMLELAQQTQNPEPFTYLTQYFVHHYLADNILTKVDRAGMQYGLEVRAPFLDVDVVDFLRCLPVSFRLKSGKTKRLLKAAMKGLLPESILQRKKKGFGMPVGHYFQQQGQLSALRPVADLNFPLVEKALEEHRQGRANHRMFLWNWLVLQSVVKQ